MEFRHALRSILRAPLFASAAALTFALGIGVNLAVFSATDRVLFRPLPYDHPERLFVMRQFRGGTEADAGLPARYAVLARRAPGFEELTLSGWTWMNLRFSESPDGARYFGFVPMAYTALKTLGVRPVVGADFSEQDARLQRRLVLITTRVWRREFGGRPDVVGQLAWGSSAGPPYEIAGVLPDDFIPPQLRATEAWSGISMSWQILDETTASTVFTPPIVRLKPGVSQAAAQAQVDAIVQQVGPEFPARDGVPASTVRLLPLRDVLFGRYTSYAALVLGAATLVLLVGCTNLASLLLIRSRSRQQRTAVLLALGASPGRLVRSACFEALILAGFGCALAILVLRLAQDLTADWLPPTFSSYVASPMQTRILLLAIALTVVSALTAGVLPGWRLSRVQIGMLLQRGTRLAGSAASTGTGALLSAEVAISVALVVGALLTGRTLAQLRDVDVGFQPDGVFTVSAYLPPSTDRAALFRQYEDMLNIIRRTPGVASAAGADTLPMIGAVNRPMFPGALGTQRCPVTDGLVETLGMRVVAGRTITAEDLRLNASVGLLSLQGLKFVWPGVQPEAAIGRRLDIPSEGSREIIGIVSDVRNEYLAPSMPTLYVPISAERFGSVLFAARVDAGGALRAADLASQFRSRGLAPRAVQVSPVAAAFTASIADQTFRARLFAGFAFVALVLALVGLYAVLSSAVALRRTELGIRLSLGATPAKIVGLILRDVARPVVIGVLTGLLIAYWASQFIQSLLYGVDARSGWIFAGVAVFFVAVATLTAWFPAHRASRTDPLSVLRQS